MNILDGNECYKKIKLFPKVEHGQIFVGSLFEWNENMKGKNCFNQPVSILHLLVWEGEEISFNFTFACMGGKGIGGEETSLLFWAFGA